MEHLGAKEALLADDPRVYFTTSHFKGYAAILVRLDRISVADLDEVVTEAWLARAPKRLVDAYLAERPAWWLGGRKGGGQRLGQGLDRLRVQRPAPVQFPGERSPVMQPVSADLHAAEAAGSRPWP